MAERSVRDRLRNFLDDLNQNSYVFLLRCENLLKTDRVTDALGLKWHNPDFELEMIKKRPERLQYIKDQTSEICMAAIQNNPRTLEYVREQTEELCLAAVQENGMLLQFVKNQTPEICKVAVLENPEAMKYVENITPEIQKVAGLQPPAIWSIDYTSSAERPMEMDEHDLCKSEGIVWHNHDNFSRAGVVAHAYPRRDSVLSPKMHKLNRTGENFLDDLIGQAESKRVAPVADAKNKTRQSEMEL